MTLEGGLRAQQAIDLMGADHDILKERLGAKHRIVLPIRYMYHKIFLMRVV